jgi:ribosomal protein S12 methylthiotransferase accessory factor
MTGTANLCAPAVGDGARFTPLSESLARLDGFISPYVGCAAKCRVHVATTDDSRVVSVGAIGRKAGTGTALTQRRALAAAAAEAVERTWINHTPASDIVVASARELGAEAVRPRRFALYHPTQYAQPDFPFVPFDDDTVVAWVRAISVDTRSPAWIPLDTVNRPRVALGPAKRVTESSSNGFACHLTWEEAVLAGLLEILERDAFCLSWYARLSHPQLRVPADTPLAESGLLPPYVSLRLVDLSAFHQVPTVLATMRSEEPDPVPLTVGAACRPTLAAAIEKAIAETCQGRLLISRMRPTEVSERDDPELVVTPEAHAEYYSVRDRLPRADFLDASQRYSAADQVREYPSRDVPTVLTEVVDAVRASGSEVFALDLTPPDVRAAGLVIAKVVCPELQPFDINHALRPLGSERLCRAPVLAGLAEEPLTFEQLNRDPHPFP